MRFSVGVCAILAAFFTAQFAVAADAVPMQPDELSVFLKQTLEAVRAFGGLPWLARISLAVTIIVGSMKVPGIREALWDKLTVKGFKLQAFLAPVLGLVGGLLSLKLEGGSITLQSALAFLGAGAGGIILYELLDAVKLTGITNKIVLGVINAIQGVIKKPVNK